MLVAVSTPGARVGKRGRRIIIRAGGEEREVPVDRIDALLVTTNVTVSYGAVKLLSEALVPVFYARGWRPMAVLMPFVGHGSVLVRREQIRAYMDWRGEHLAKAFAWAATENKAALLLALAKSRGGELAEGLREAAFRIRELGSRIRSEEGAPDSLRARLMGLEGEAASIYYSTLALVLPEELGFKGRTRRPPRDVVNAALSLGYSLLNLRVSIALAVCGLEPYAGFLHSDRSGKPSLTLDLAEEFRQPIVDRAVITLAVRRQLTPEDYDSGLLSEKAKKLLLQALQERLTTETKAGKRKSSYEQEVFRQARRLARFLLGKDREYKPFTYRW